MRDRLIELIYQNSPRLVEEEAKDLANRLIANGVIVLPEKIYRIVDAGTKHAFIEGVSPERLHLYALRDLKKYGYYLTKEEAEKALRGEGE